VKFIALIRSYEILLVCVFLEDLVRPMYSSGTYRFYAALPHFSPFSLDAVFECSNSSLGFLFIPFPRNLPRTCCSQLGVFPFAGSLQHSGPRPCCNPPLPVEPVWSVGCLARRFFPWPLFLEVPPSQRFGVFAPPLAKELVARPLTGKALPVQDVPCE